MSHVERDAICLNLSVIIVQLLKLLRARVSQSSEFHKL